MFSDILTLNWSAETMFYVHSDLNNKLLGVMYILD